MFDSCERVHGAEKLSNVSRTKVRTHTQTLTHMQQELHKYKQNIKCAPPSAPPPARLAWTDTANVTLFRLANGFLAFCSLASLCLWSLSAFGFIPAVLLFCRPLPSLLAPLLRCAKNMKIACCWTPWRPSPLPVLLLLLFLLLLLLPFSCCLFVC